MDVPKLGSTWKSKRGDFTVGVFSVKFPTPYQFRHGEQILVGIEKLPREPGIHSWMTLEHLERDMEEVKP